MALRTAARSVVPEDVRDGLGGAREDLRPVREPGHDVPEGIRAALVVEREQIQVVQAEDVLPRQEHVVEEDELVHLLPPCIDRVILPAGAVVNRGLPHDERQARRVDRNRGPDRRVCSQALAEDGREGEEVSQRPHTAGDLAASQDDARVCLLHDSERSRSVVPRHGPVRLGVEDQVRAEEVELAREAHEPPDVVGELGVLPFHAVDDPEEPEGHGRTVVRRTAVHSERLARDRLDGLLLGVQVLLLGGHLPSDRSPGPRLLVHVGHRRLSIRMQLEVQDTAHAVNGPAQVRMRRNVGDLLAIARDDPPPVAEGLLVLLTAQQVRFRARRKHIPDLLDTRMGSSTYFHR